jgi:uncharacterized repeat protein (TIGR02543 family)
VNKHKRIYSILIAVVMVLFTIPSVAVAYSSAGNLAIGDNFMVALKQDGSLWTWGNNASGQLGLGTTAVSQATPALVASTSAWKYVDAGGLHTLAIKADGSLWTWGSNAFGQLGDGSTSGRNQPIRIGTDTDWKMVAAGYDFSLALKTNGRLYAWGNAAAGCLGLGNGFASGLVGTPRQVDSNTWMTIAAGGQSAAGVKNDGTGWVWGRVQMTAGGTVVYFSPQRKGSASGWTMVELSDRTSTGAVTGAWVSNSRSTDNLYTWGYNGSAQTGSGNATTSYYGLPGSELLIPSAGSVKQASIGEAHTFVVRTNGTLWGWGANGYGQVGNGATVARQTTPVQIRVVGSVASAVAGSNVSAAITSGGTLYSWGSGTYLGRIAGTENVTAPRLVVGEEWGTPLPKYTVTFNTQGGAAVAARQVMQGRAVGELPVPVRANAGFQGWFTAATGGTQVNISYVVNRNVTLYAHWSTAVVTVKFDGRNGQASRYKTVYVPGKLSSFPAADFPTSKPADSRNVFLGWYTAVSGGTRLTSSYAFSKAQTYTFYAHWRLDYAVRFISQGKTINTGWVQKGKAMGALPKVSRTNYRLVGWYRKSEKAKPTRKVDVMGLRYTAKWVNTVSTIKSLKTSSGKVKPGFSASKKSGYKLTIAAGKKSVTLTPKRKSGSSKMTYRLGKKGKWKKLPKGKIKVALAKGQSKTVQIRVIAQDTTKKSIYKITVKREKSILREPRCPVCKKMKPCGKCDCGCGCEKPPIYG